MPTNQAGFALLPARDEKEAAADGNQIFEQGQHRSGTLPASRRR